MKKDKRISVDIWKEMLFPFMEQLGFSGRISDNDYPGRIRFDTDVIRYSFEKDGLDGNRLRTNLLGSWQYEITRYFPIGGNVSMHLHHNAVSDFMKRHIPRLTDLQLRYTIVAPNDFRLAELIVDTVPKAEKCLLLIAEHMHDFDMLEARRWSSLGSLYTYLERYAPTNDVVGLRYNTVHSDHVRLYLKAHLRMPDFYEHHKSMVESMDYVMVWAKGQDDSELLERMTRSYERRDLELTSMMSELEPIYKDVDRVVEEVEYIKYPGRLCRVSIMFEEAKLDTPAGRQMKAEIEAHREIMGVKEEKEKFKSYWKRKCPHLL